MQAEKNKRARRRNSYRLPVGQNGGIQLLLVQTVDSLGKVGEVVEVKKGYAKNYLIPQGLAVVASDHHRRMIEKRKIQLEELRKERVAKAQVLASEIAAKTVTIESNANDDGHLYGSVAPEEIAAALKANGIEISPEAVRLTGPIKETGMYNIDICLGDEVNTTLKLWVVQIAGGKQ